MKWVELQMRRRNVLEFIKADPIDLVLTREAEVVKTEAGGFTRAPGGPTILDPQLARIVQNRRRYNNGIVNAEAGDIPHTDYLLIGMHTLDVEVDDTFFWQSEQYRITGIHEQRIESTLCSIDLRGPVNRA